MKPTKWVEQNIVIRHFWALFAVCCAAYCLAASSLPYGFGLAVALVALPGVQLVCGLAGDSKARTNPRSKAAEKLLRMAALTDSILNAIPLKPFAGMTIFNLQNIARMRRAQGSGEEAESYNRQALRLLETTVNDSVMLTLAYKDLSLSLIEQSRGSEAEELAREALAVMPKDASPLGSYFAYSTLCTALNMQERFTDSLITIQLAEELGKELETETRNDRIQLYRAYRHNILLDKIRALSHFSRTEEVVEARQQLLNSDLVGVESANDVAMTHSNVGYGLMNHGDHEGAGEVLAKALTLMEQPGVEEKTRAYILGNYGDLCWRLGRLDEAEQNSLHALELLQKLQGEAGEDISWCALDLGRIYRDKGDRSKAELYFTRALNILSSQDPPDVKKLAEAQQELEALKQTH